MEILVLDSSLDNSHYVISHLHKIKDRLANIHTYVTCGSSSVIGLLLCVGMQPKDINSALLHQDIFNGCSDVSESAYYNVRNVLKYILLNYYEIIPTLSQLKEITNKTLYLSSFNDTLQKVEYFSAETHPELDCITACTFAYNLPYKHFTRSYCGNLYVDASYKEPLPIEIIKNRANVLCVYTTIKPVEIVDYKRPNQYFYYLLFSSFNSFKHLLAGMLNPDAIVINLEVDFCFDNLSVKEKINMCSKGARD